MSERKRINRKRIGFAARYVLLLGALLLVTDVIFVAVVVNQSASTIRGMVRKNMLNISNTAAELINGDRLGALTEEDVGSAPFNEILKQLSAFQKNVDIEYIYAVRQVGEDRFVFTVDPDPVDPGEFGEEVVVTAALRSAAAGIAMVDDEPVMDEWGNFYSSYSPVMNSRGEVAGIVGVDFGSAWYEEQIRNQMLSMTVISAITLVLGGVLIVILTGNLRRRLQAINDELTALSADVDELAEEIKASPGFMKSEEQKCCGEAAEGGEQDAMDEIGVLGEKLHLMHMEVKLYLDFAHKKAYTDALTGVRNTTAYLEMQERINAGIQDGSAAFSTAVFDINDLKQVNDQFGHAEGDRIIRGAARAILEVFGIESTFRIGGDEFLALAEHVDESGMQELLHRIDERIAAYNKEDGGKQGRLSVSMGCAEYKPGEDKSFKSVFIRADELMYRRKSEYHASRSSCSLI